MIPKIQNKRKTLNLVSRTLNRWAEATLRLDKNFLSRKFIHYAASLPSTSVQEDFLTNIFLRPFVGCFLLARVKRKNRLRFIASFNIILLRKLFIQ